MSKKLFLNRLLIPELVDEIFDTIVEHELSLSVNCHCTKNEVFH